ncbi:MAG: phage gp6-like head-tail connector family protein [Verrucomicrobiales bacterium]|nr:phage gp6-like head-tail connector family protein [Verrucomicrobiales bacterium]
MLTQLSTVKTRLNISDTSADILLTSAIAAVSERFDRECNRRFARQIDAIEEFPADSLEICPANWPIETVAGFDLKTNETTGWQPLSPTPDYLVRNHCVISLECAAGSRFQQARVTYTGGYVLPGTTPDAGQTALPSDIEQACVEQVAYWYQNRNSIGVLTSTVGAGSHLPQGDLLPCVASILKKYTRMNFD